MSKLLELPLLARHSKLKAVISRGPQTAGCLSVIVCCDAWHQKMAKHSCKSSTRVTVTLLGAVKWESNESTEKISLSPTAL